MFNKSFNRTLRYLGAIALLFAGLSLPSLVAAQSAAPPTDRKTSTPYSGDLSIFDTPGRDERLQVNRVMPYSPCRQRLPAESRYVPKSVLPGLGRLPPAAHFQKSSPQFVLVGLRPAPSRPGLQSRPGLPMRATPASPQISRSECEPQKECIRYSFSSRIVLADYQLPYHSPTICCSLPPI